MWSPRARIRPRSGARARSTSMIMSFFTTNTSTWMNIFMLLTISFSCLKNLDSVAVEAFQGGLHEHVRMPMRPRLWQLQLQPQQARRKPWKNIIPNHHGRRAVVPNPSYHPKSYKCTGLQGATATSLAGCCDENDDHSSSYGYGNWCDCNCRGGNNESSFGRGCKEEMKQVEETLFHLMENSEAMEMGMGMGKDDSNRCKNTHTRRELFSALGIASSTIPFLQYDSTNARAAEATTGNSNVNNDRKSNANASANDNINIAPFSSVRKQKLITLSNGLKVLLVNDKRASQSTAALVVNGPGQFKDPRDLPGAAHLMEHMILSYTGDNNYYQYFGNGIVGGIAGKKRGVSQQDSNLENWLSEKGGTSNAFTAYHQTCFHLNCPHDVLGGALERFATLFVESNVADVCRNEKVLAREVRRVDQELDFDIEGGNNLQVQQEYITKSFVNPEHPYSKFSRGSLESLETIPKENGVNVSDRLIQFFHRYYLPTQAVLVVVSNQHNGQTPQLQQEFSFSSLERWVSPFSVTMSKKEQKRGRKTAGSSNSNANAYENTEGNYFYPGRFLRGNRYKHLVLYRKSQGGTTTKPSTSSYNNSARNGGEKLILQWVLNEDYRGGPNNNKRINVTEIAFALNQILGRRGPGSLYLFLRKRGWIQNGSILPPQVTVPVNVSGFQVLKMELSLTLEGFLNRSRIVAAVYDSIETVRNPGTDTFVISREIMAQYATMAKLFGFILAPRPSDAVELAVDSMNYGVATVQSGKWYRFPSTEDLGGLGLNRMRRAVSSALATMSDPEDALIIVTAGDDAIAQSQTGGQGDPIPPLVSPKWKTESISGARVYSEDMLQLRSSRLLLEQAILANIISQEELLPPQFNPLVPTSLRPPRTINNELTIVPATKKYDDSTPYAQQNNDRWTVLIPGQIKMRLPRSPPEVNYHSAFVLQLLSSRPARASAEQAAYAELWKLTFDAAAVDLAELGAPGGLAYEMRFNKYGLRLSFLGLSQTLPSYARRMTQLLVKHQMQLLDRNGSLVESNKSLAIASANRARDLSATRKRVVINTLQKATVYNVAFEGISFLRSCTGGVCFSQGDLTTSETSDLFQNLRDILKNSIGRVEEGEVPAVVPAVEDLVDSPAWKPRNASPCYIAGVSLVSDACGRVPR